MHMLFFGGRIVCDALSMHISSEAWHGPTQSSSAFGVPMKQMLEQRAQEQVAWVVARLDHIASAMGIWQAQAFAKSLRKHWQDCAKLTESDTLIFNIPQGHGVGTVHEDSVD